MVTTKGQLLKADTPFKAYLWPTISSTTQNPWHGHGAKETAAAPSQVPEPNTLRDTHSILSPHDHPASSPAAAAPSQVPEPSTLWDTHSILSPHDHPASSPAAAAWQQSSAGLRHLQACVTCSCRVATIFCRQAHLQLPRGNNLLQACVNHL